MASTINASTSAGLVSTADTSGVLQLQTAGTTAVTVDASQNVGVGTATPSASDWNASATVVQSYKNTTNGGLFKASSSNTNFIFSAGNNLAYIATTTNTPITFYTNTTERARIDSSGNFGVGTSSPASYGGSAFTKSVNVGSLNTITAGFSDEVSGTFRIAHASGQNILNFDTSALCFQSGGSTPTERARITSGGDLLVGKTAVSDTTVGSQIKPNGVVTLTNADSTNGTYGYQMYSTGASAYRFYVGYGGTVYATSTTITAISDQRLKENIRDLDEGLTTVMALKPRKFDWKEGKGQNIKNARGFIAQEFEIVLPDMIEEWRDPAPQGEESYKAINANLIPTLVKAIQEQQIIIESLKSRLDAANL